jgi:hypothetical protein
MRIVLLTLAALAGAALAATQASAAPEADQCLAKPKGVAPAGKHWYFNTDRKSQRKCWYLADEGEKIVTPAPRKQAAAAPPADKGREAAQLPQPQTVDARAELVEQPRNEQHHRLRHPFSHRSRRRRRLPNQRRDVTGPLRRAGRSRPIRLRPALRQ